jgi:RHS repeat-associated protein
VNGGSVSYKADVAPHAPGGAPGGMIDEVEQDGEKETLAALAADPEREPLAKDSVEIESISGPHTVSYDNDAINRRSMTDSNLGIPINFARNALNQYTAVDGHGALNYDGNLNVSGYDGWAFVHDAEKRLLSVTGNGHSAQFAYDGLGRCVKRTIDGATTLFTYDGWKPVAEWTGAGVFVAWNLYGVGADEILVRYQANPVGYLHYHLDAMGNVQFLLSDDPEPGLEKYTYDVFGKPTIIGWDGNVRPISNHGNRFLFTGREYLYTFGLYDYRHRIYHPGLGRFIETDPLGQQIEGAKLSVQQTAMYALGGTAPEKFGSSELNFYRYCHNDPVNKTDPFGLEVDVETRSLGVWTPHGYVLIANHSWVKVVTEDGIKTTFSGTNKGTLGVEKNYKPDYNAFTSSKQPIPPPQGMTQKEWDQKVLKEGEKQLGKDGKRDYKPLGGDGGDKSGNCHTVAREIIDGAGGSIPKTYDPPGANPGLFKEKEKR